MNILVDLTQIPKQKVGVGVYALQTFNNIINIDLNNKYFFIVQNDDVDFDIYSSERVMIIKINAKIYRSFFFRLIFEQLQLPLLILKYGIDVIHSLHYSFPLLKFGAKRVVTIHDLTFFLYPHLHTFVKRHYFKLFIRLSLILENSLICVSESTALDLKKIFGEVLRDVSVVPLAMEDRSKLALQEDEVIRKFKLPKDFILFIGTLEPRKNLLNLIDAFRLLIENNESTLVIVGKKGWFYDDIFKKVKDYELENQIIFTGFVTEIEKYSILKLSTIFIYPSIYEGFGLPVLEALAFEKPTITSNVSSMPEVAGDAAILIDPNNVLEMSKALELVLHDKNLQDKLKRKALIQSTLFSWKNTALKTLKVYYKTINK